MRVDVAPPDAKIWLDRYLPLFGRSFGRYVCKNTNLHVRVLLAHVAGETVGKLQHKPCVASVLVSALDAVVFRDDLPALRAEADEVGVVHLREVVDERIVPRVLAPVLGDEREESFEAEPPDLGVRHAQLPRRPALAPSVDQRVVFGMLLEELLRRQVAERRVARAGLAVRVADFVGFAVTTLHLVRGHEPPARRPPVPRAADCREDGGVVDGRLHGAVGGRDLQTGIEIKRIIPFRRQVVVAAEPLGEVGHRVVEPHARNGVDEHAPRPAPDPPVAAAQSLRRASGRGGGLGPPEIHRRVKRLRLAALYIYDGDIPRHLRHHVGEVGERGSAPRAAGGGEAGIGIPDDRAVGEPDGRTEAGDGGQRRQRHEVLGMSIHGDAADSQPPKPCLVARRRSARRLPRSGSGDRRASRNARPTTRQSRTRTPAESIPSCQRGSCRCLFSSLPRF